MSVKMAMSALVPGHRRVAGLSMIEVLVTIVIISFGMLGIAGMVLRSIESGTISSGRGIAVWQANEMADRLRANIAGVREGHYDDLVGAPVADCNSPCLTAQCTPDEQASFDFCLWNARNQQVLPLGRGSVALVPGGGCATSQLVCAFDITVSWDEGKTGNPLALRQYVLRVEP